MATPTAPSQMFELHQYAAAPEDDAGAMELSWCSQESETSASEPLVIDNADEVVWVGRSESGNSLGIVREREQAFAGFLAVHRRHGRSLAMLTGRSDVLVNGRRALPLSMLAIKDSIVLGPDFHVYLTERVRPYHGQPPAEFISKPCPFCRLDFTAETTLVVCRCGTAYHLEPYPAAGEDADADSDVLRCFEKVEKCLSCGRALTRKEYLEWNPASTW